MKNKYLIEAERRIQECKATKNPILDLNALGLTLATIPANFWELSHLEALNLGNTYVYDKDKEEWRGIAID